MLIYQPWVHTAPDMLTEWEQCLDEGHDVAAFREMCETISRSGFAWDEAAKKIVAVRDEGTLISRIELQEKSGISKSVMQLLSDNGALDGLPETNQLSLFDMF